MAHSYIFTCLKCGKELTRDINGELQSCTCNVLENIIPVACNGDTCHFKMQSDNISICIYRDYCDFQCPRDSRFD